MKNITPVARKKSVVTQEASGELLIYRLDDNKAFCLNETSAAIWKLCDGENSVSQISDLMTAKLKSSVSEDFVWLALEQFGKDNLLADKCVKPFDGISRRETIRRVALASAVALPAVSSLLAPSSARAASTVCDCVTPGDCLTKTSCPSSVNCNPSGQCAP